MLDESITEKSQNDLIQSPVEIITEIHPITECRDDLTFLSVFLNPADFKRFKQPRMFVCTFSRKTAGIFF